MQSLLIYIPKITARHQYVFELIFNEIYQIDYKLTDDKPTYLTAQTSKLNYSLSPICEREIFIEAHSLLNERGINQVSIQIGKYKNCPVFFQTSNESAFAYDIFAASFYLVSRYEEYLPHLKDKYNRFKAEESLAFKHNFLQKPVVNIWAKQLISVIDDKFPYLKIKHPRFKYISTIDIDNAFLYKGKGFMRSIAFLLKAMLRFDIDSLKMAVTVISKKRKDPFDTFSLQLNLQKKYNLDVRYFVLLGDYGLNDKNISHTNSNFQTLVKGLSDLTPVGIHPSFGSSINETKLAIEIKRLEDIQKREVTFSRQHFLQLSFPKTYKRLLEVGITNDYTMGYASVLGFRAGITSSFTFYNLDMEQVLPIKIHPFAIVDDTLKFNMQLNPDDVVQQLSEIINEVKQVDGTLISIWHNDTFSDVGVWKGWRNVYEDIVKLIYI
ncbi:MAG: hypothetical protein HN522_04495 [Flavobacteriales bacterium]|jgi:hypothetical protein|nr:hypothetical protein [Flavobacteriales bacterium]MBT5749984.1 hypothetical protein [Flavobacteriales bacterium]